MNALLKTIFAVGVYAFVSVASAAPLVFATDGVKFFPDVFADGLTVDFDSSTGILTVDGDARSLTLPLPGDPSQPAGTIAGTAGKPLLVAVGNPSAFFPIPVPPGDFSVSVQFDASGNVLDNAANAVSISGDAWQTSGGVSKILGGDLFTGSVLNFGFEQVGPSEGQLQFLFSIDPGSVLASYDAYGVPLYDDNPGYPNLGGILVNVKGLTRSGSPIADWESELAGLLAGDFFSNDINSTADAFVVPIPPAALLFGSALAVLGALRQRNP